MAKKKNTIPLEKSEGMLLPESGKWNFHGMLNQHTRVQVIDDFEPPLTKRGRGRMANSLDILTQQPKTNWSKPRPASNIKNSKYVIRFKDENGMQRRMYGHFYDLHEAFVITLTGHEADNKYYPVDYQQRCDRLERECSRDFSDNTEPLPNRCKRCEPQSEGQHTRIAPSSLSLF